MTHRPGAPSAQRRHNNFFSRHMSFTFYLNAYNLPTTFFRQLIFFLIELKIFFFET
jgi:hypothetical protein